MPRITNLTRASFQIAFLFTLDKGLAFIKSLLFNKIVGLEGMGIFGASNNIPDYLSALLSGGALGMAFIPVLREFLDTKGRPEAWQLFARVVNLAFLFTAGVSVLIFIFSEPLVRYIVAPSFTPQNQNLTASLMRLDLIAILLFSISGLVMSGLQANKHFLLPALAPIFYNLGQIFGVTILTPATGQRIGAITLPAFDLGLYGMVFGVIMGAVMHLLIQVPGLIRFGFKWVPGLGLSTISVQRVLLLLWPRVLTMASIQAYFIMRDSLASKFGSEGVGALNLGWTIQQVPETIIGTSIAIALLPSLSEYINARNNDLFIDTVNRALRIMLAFSFILAVLISICIRPLVAGFFGFERTQLNLVVWCSWAFLAGLLGDTWLETAVRAFYANQDTRTPLIASVLQSITFFGLAWILSNELGLPGIPIAAAITFSLQAIGLHLILNKKFPGILVFNGTLPRTLLAGVFSGVAAWLGIHYLPFSQVINGLISLAIGSIVTLPILRKELHMLFHL